MNFEEQFQKKLSVSVGGKNIYFVDVGPDNAVAVPIFLGPGWGETPKTLNQQLSYLTDLTIGKHRCNNNFLMLGCKWL